MKKIFSLTILASFFISCEKEIPLNAEQSDPKLVFNSIFEANDTLWVNLQRSKSIIDQNTIHPIITGANVTLHLGDGSLVATLTETTEGNYYLASTMPAIGVTYELRAEKSGYVSISAQSTAPQPIVPISIDTLMNSQGNLEFSINVNDPAGEDNYYSVTCVSYYAYFDFETFDTVYYEDAYYSTNETYVDNGFEDVDGKTYDLEFFFSDKTFNGQNFTFTGERDIYMESDEELICHAITIRSLSYDLYQYKISYNKYVETQGNPFAEPVRVYSNVENGLGIFGGASIYSDTLWVE
ncbi:MAG: DUF4249 domain-containing protein [Crocinitomicaceae bacterium]|nr:DUF4249 domain-containing protein [Crocinitomicaceae bacterium]